jgi:hypothetical protein
MAEKDLELLRALYSASAATGSSEPLPAERVNELGALLALSEEDVFHLVERLRKEGLLEVQWGGKVVLTEKGKERVTGRTVAAVPGSVSVIFGNIGPGASPSVAVGDHATAGPGATGAGAVRIEVPRGDLAAALQALRLAQEELPPEAKAPARELQGELESIHEEMQRPEPDKPKLEMHLARAEGLLGTINNISKAAAGLFAPAGLIGLALVHLGRWLAAAL